MKIKNGTLISINKKKDIKNGHFTIPDTVKRIDDAVFQYCKGLKSVTIPDSVTHIGDDAFRCCTSLENIIIPGSVTGIGPFAFCSCTSLTSVTIRSGVTYICSYAFYGCIELTNVTIPDSVKYIGMSAFDYCNKLKRPNISVNTIKAVKGFYEYGDNLVCKNFVYEVGKTYDEPKAKLCESGFHACMLGLDVFTYYAGNNAVYYEVELSGISPERKDDSKICGTTITILRKLTVAEAANYVSKEVEQ